METLDAAVVIKQHGLTYFRELATFGALSDQVIQYILSEGCITHYKQGEYLQRQGTANDFQVVLSGRIAYYKHYGGQDVLTRYFNAGEQMGFDLMLGMIPHNGTDVAEADSQILDIDCGLFYRLHERFPADFGLLMINLTRELSREIALLEDVIGESYNHTLPEQ
ncbi:Crp/Fnr family transcriptional regulator [Dasania marina]|uniref:Crp/Fnr family transcriptional regulator n=1 Tax=Dasania marina TaxID=471499 RepID=UPI000361AEC6|nr:cyclic nucleotide-binding domain-containing protein [Dasania marina]